MDDASPIDPVAFTNLFGKTEPPEMIRPKEGDEYALHLVFKRGLQYEVYVTKFEPVKDSRGRIVSAEIGQDSLMPGDQIIASIDWDEIAFAAVSWDPDRNRR